MAVKKLKRLKVVMAEKDLSNTLMEEKTEFVQTYFANPDFLNFVNARVF